MLFTPHTAKMLNIKQVETLFTAITKADAKRFENSVTMSSLILSANVWLKDAEGQIFYKEFFEDMDDFVFKTYGFQKSRYYKLLKMAKAIEKTPGLISEFNKQCDAILENGGEVSRSVENFNKFVDEYNLETPATNGSEEGEEGEEGAKVQEKKKAILTFAFNGEQIGLQNMALRIDANGELKTTASAFDIETAIDFLKQALEGANKLATETTIEVQAPAVEQPAKKSKKVSIECASMKFVLRCLRFKE
jgi:hypothetical protein